MERVRTNPIIPGFAPDPSLVYVNGTYYLVNSSFHLFPGLPVYASTDLLEWKHIGNALNRTGLISLQESMTKLAGPDEQGLIAAEGGLYAPTIRHHDGTFYIVCTNVKHNQVQVDGESGYQNFILSTNDIWADEWSDPVFYDFEGIDTSLFWDDDGRVYLVGSGAAPGSVETTILQFEIDIKTGSKLSEEKLLWEGITKVFPEGPHTYKKDGWYYLLISEGGCYADHHVIMARSRNIWGPYEANPANPVLPKADKSGYIQYTGHGDLFQHPSGQWYFACLGVRKNDGHFIMGRESVLTTATWPEGEYPEIDPVQVEVPLPTKREEAALAPTRRRRIDCLTLGFVHIRDPIREHYKNDGKTITLTASKGEIAQFEKPVTFIGKRQRRLDGSASATLRPLPSSGAQGAALKTGLCYYKDEHRYVQAFQDVDAGEIVLKTVNKAKTIERRTSQKLCKLGENANLTFGVDYTELEFVFWYSTGSYKETKVELGKLDTLDMTGHDFVGPVIGIFATGEREVEVQYADLVVA